MLIDNFNLFLSMDSKVILPVKKLYSIITAFKQRPLKPVIVWGGRGEHRSMRRFS